jgi:outer membrane immunogenic protein
MMKNVLVVGILFTASMTAAAVAADLPPPIINKSPVPIFTWTGGYVGGFAGAAIPGGNATSSEPCAVAGGCAFAQYNVLFPGAPAFSNSYRPGASFLGGGTIGYNWQVPNQKWVLGLEGEGGYLHARQSVLDVNAPVVAGVQTPNGFDTTRLGDGYGVIAGRVGWAWNRVLWYGKGGVAFVEKHWDFTDTCTTAPCGTNSLSLGRSFVQTTWAAGGGVEWAVFGPWNVKAEYLYLATQQTYSSTGTAAGVGAVTGIPFTSTHTDPGLHTVKFGVNYHFGG